MNVVCGKRKFLACTAPPLPLKREKINHVISPFSSICTDALFNVMSYFHLHEQFMYRRLNRHHYQQFDIVESLTRSKIQTIEAWRPPLQPFQKKLYDIYPAFIRIFTLLWTHPRVFHKLRSIDLRGFSQKDINFLLDLKAFFPISLEEFIFNPSTLFRAGKLCGFRCCEIKNLVIYNSQNTYNTRKLSWYNEMLRECKVQQMHFQDSIPLSDLSYANMPDWFTGFFDINITKNSSTTNHSLPQQDLPHLKQVTVSIRVERSNAPATTEAVFNFIKDRVLAPALQHNALFTKFPALDTVHLVIGLRTHGTKSAQKYKKGILYTRALHQSTLNEWE